MAATKGAMTSLPTSQILFTSAAEQPEQNRINFRDSLKFFQEQLVINGENFPSPSACKIGSDSRKNGARSYKEQNVENSGKGIKDNDLYENEIQSTKSCKISIPTVDTILESVRVLRAIQKSQQERGSTWNLDVTSKSDIDTDFQLTDDWIHFTDEKHNSYYQESNNTKNDELTAVYIDKSALTELPNEINGESWQNISRENEIAVSPLPHSSATNKLCPFWPSNNLTCEKQVVPEVIYDLPNSGTIKVEFSADNINKFLNDSNIFYSETVSNTTEKIILEDEDRKNKEEYEHVNFFENNTSTEQNDCWSVSTIDCEHVPLNTATNKNTEIYNISNSLNSTRKDILYYVTENTSNVQQETSKEMIEKENPSTEMLEIDTYDDINTQKEEFLISESIWKNNCSPDESNSIKTETNDNDSGIGTQRSASSLSPNNPIQVQKDSWSEDTCSSHYASAECSPYHSLSSVFESSQELNFTPTTTVKRRNDVGTSTDIPSSNWEESQNGTENEIAETDEQRDALFSPVQTDFDRENENVPDHIEEIKAENEFKSDDNEFKLQETIDSTTENEKISSPVNFITNYTLESPTITTAELLEDIKSVSDTCGNLDNQPKITNVLNIENHDSPKANEKIVNGIKGTNKTEDDSPDAIRIQKLTAASCDLVSIVKSLYTIKENPAYQILPAKEKKFEKMLFILSRGAFCEHPEGNYLVKVEDSILYIEKDSELLLSLSMKYAEISVSIKNVLKIDNKMGRCLYLRGESESLMILKDEIEFHCLKHWQSDCLQLVHYPLKCHQNVIIIDLGSCSTRAGILMDQPTLPSLFFPTVCATHKTTGNSVYGMEALQPEVRQHSNLSFPVRPSIKITKHTIDIDLLEGLFKKIFHDLQVIPSEYIVQVCLPRNLSINAQNDLVKLLLENLKVKAVSLTNQALLVLYAHDISTAIVVDIGDRTDVLPVVDGFIVENGVTKLPHGGQRLIHHMKHSLAEKHLSLSNDVDSFVVQYIIENLAYVAEDYASEIQISSKYPELVKKTITLQPTSESISRTITLDEARFKVAEGLFNPEMWGLDSPGIHHLVQKAIQATSVDVRKKIAQNIYVSGGVTMLPGFVERLNKEVTKLSKAKIIPKVCASNYRYHCTYIGACQFAKMEVFPQVCVTMEEYSKNNILALKKFALYF